MVRVEEADQLILSMAKDYGTETVSFHAAAGRVLAENIFADRDIPAFNRVSMDGIAIRWSAFEKGLRRFRITGMQAAGVAPVEIIKEDDCIEIMTGASIPHSADTVVRYEDVELRDGFAMINSENITRGQHIHFRGKDKKEGDVVLHPPRVVDAAVINMLASVGRVSLAVKKLPRVVVISTGDELKDIDESILPWEIRRSNNYAINAVLASFHIHPHLIHISDDLSVTDSAIRDCLENFDVLLITGGVSMGKLDYVPLALQSAGVSKVFHKVQQRPGKPFWFGSHPGGALVFAFPGNPVSTFMCLHRYFLPWLQSSLCINSGQKLFAVLGEDIEFLPPLQYFLQVKVECRPDGRLVATPEAGNGSGDFSNLTDTQAFMELPAEQTIFRKGEVFRLWPYSRII